MATEKYIDEQIENLQKQFEEEDLQRKEQTVDEEGKFIDEQIQDIRRQIGEDEEEEEKKKRDETFSKEEKRLLSKIESKLSVIQFLSNSLESAEKDLKDLEEQLEVIRDCKNM